MKVYRKYTSEKIILTKLRINSKYTTLKKKIINRLDEHLYIIKTSKSEAKRN